MSNIYDDFKQNGYLVLKDFLTKEVQEVIVILKHFMNSQLADDEKEDDFDLLVNKIFLGDKKMRQFIYDNSRNVAHIQGLFRNHRLLQLLRDCGVEVPFYTNFPSVRFDLAGEKEHMYLRGPHQDLRSIVSEVAYTIWIPLTEISKERGGVCLYPGSEKHGVLPHKLYPNNELDRDISKKLLDEKVVVDSLEVGDVAIFNSLMVHASVPGTTGMKCVCFQQVSDGAKFNVEIAEGRSKIPLFRDELAKLDM